jgi:hypothetical protein
MAASWDRACGWWWRTVDASVGCPPGGAGMKRLIASWARWRSASHDVDPLGGQPVPRAQPIPGRRWGAAEAAPDMWFPRSRPVWTITPGALVLIWLARRFVPPLRPGDRLLEALLIDWHRGHPHGVRRGRGRSNARLLRRRGPLHSVRPRLCRGLPGIIGLRLPPGCLAVRSRRVRLVGSRTPALVAPNLRRRALTGRGRARTRCSDSGGRTRAPRSGYRTPGTRS